MKLVSVILCGGAGTRLWPASRQAYPKPFMKVGGSSLLAQAVARAQACGSDNLLVITNEEHLFPTRSVVVDVADPANVHYLLEPKGRNTGPAIALAALHCAKVHGPDVVLLVLPADHLIPDTAAFVACTIEAAQLACKSQLVVFGINPTGPETGFGYLEVEQVARHSQPVRSYAEKPDLATAQGYVATGRYYWNSGMFCFTAATMLDALAEHAGYVMKSARQAFESARTAGPVTHFDAQLFGLQPDISLDYAVMEKARNVTVVPARFNWTDVGSWPAVAQAHPADGSGNTFVSDVVALDTRGTHVQVESHGPKVVATVGVTDLVVVDTPDALLVAHKSAAQRIKAVVEILVARGHESAQQPAAINRPWGTYATLKEEPGYKVKRITVKPGESLSLQYHHQRAEHWVVVQGAALVQVGDQLTRSEPGQYHYIPREERHRLTNVGTGELVLIEVQCGAYLGEDDIVRLADTYGRH